MKKFLVRIDPHLLRNKTFVQFLKDLIALIDLLGAGAVGVKTISDTLKVKSAVVASILEYILKSSITAKLKVQDRLRDNLLRGLAMAIKSYLHHPNADKHDAATRLSMVMDHYGSIPKNNYDDESAAIDDLLREFNATELAALVTLLDLGDWITQLTAANARFFELMHQRYDEEAKRPAISMQEARAAAEEDLSALLDRVEAIVTLNGIDFTPELESFVKEYNVIATRYKHVLAIEKGRRRATANKSGEGDEGDEDIDDEDDGDWDEEGNGNEVPGNEGNGNEGGGNEGGGNEGNGNEENPPAK